MKASTLPPMLAKATEPATSPRSVDAQGGAADQVGLRTVNGPEEVLDTLRQFLEIGQLPAARRLLAAAVDRYPEYAEIQKARRILDQREATPNPMVEPTTSDEIEWLQSPPESARGKWVALIGRQVVGMAHSARELKKILQSKDLPQKPLIHHIAP